MSEALESAQAKAPVVPGVPPNDGPGASTAAAATDAVSEAGQQETKEKKPTKYVVLISNAEDGPYSKVGEFDGFGQDQAKKAAGEALISSGTEGVAALFFTAVPSTSWSPKQPAGVKLEPQITF